MLCFIYFSVLNCYSITFINLFRSLLPRRFTNLSELAIVEMRTEILASSIHDYIFVFLLNFSHEKEKNNIHNKDKRCIKLKALQQDTLTRNKMIVNSPLCRLDIRP